MTLPEAWPFPPLFNGSSETLEWMTDLLQGTTGEQRIADRYAPRQTFEYAHKLESSSYARAKAMARRLGGSYVAAPVWIERVAYSGTIGATDTVLTFDTTFGDYRSGGMIFVFDTDANFAVGEIDTVSGTGVTLTVALGKAFTNPAVMPARKAHLTEGVKVTRHPTYADCAVKLAVRDNALISQSSPYDQYNSLDVMTDDQVMIADISESVVRAAEYIDSGIGPVVLESVRDYIDFGQTISWLENTGADLWARRAWLHSRFGKQKPFWLPSGNYDLVPTGSIGTLDTAISVESVDNAANYVGRHVFLLLKDGTRFYRSIDAASNVSAGVDSITISSALGRSVTVADIDRFSFMAKVRLNSDSIQLDYSTPTRVKVSSPVIEVPA